MADQQELRPTSTPISERFCPSCKTPMSSFNELGVYWWWHCETCSFSGDDVIDLEPEDHQALTANDKPLSSGLNPD